MTDTQFDGTDRIGEASLKEHDNASRTKRDTHVVARFQHGSQECHIGRAMSVVEFS